MRPQDLPGWLLTQKRQLEPVAAPLTVSPSGRAKMMKAMALGAMWADDAQDGLHAGLGQAGDGFDFAGGGHSPGGGGGSASPGSRSGWLGHASPAGGSLRGLSGELTGWGDR